MNKHSVLSRLISCIALFIGVTALAGCHAPIATWPTPTLTPTSTPEKLKLVNGELDPCQLITLEEVETVLGIEVFRKKGFADGLICLYRSKTGEHFLFHVLINTDATLQRQNSPASLDSAAELYDGLKGSRLRLSQKMPQVYSLKEIEGLGDQAFLADGGFWALHVLNNGIYYEFVTHIDNGIGIDLLFALAQIAQQRMP